MTDFQRIARIILFFLTPFFETHHNIFAIVKDFSKNFKAKSLPFLLSDLSLVELFFHGVVLLFHGGSMSDFGIIARFIFVFFHFFFICKSLILNDLWRRRGAAVITH